MTTILDAPHPRSGKMSFDRPLELRLRAADDGPILARRALRPADLSDLRSECWLELCLRRGLPGVGVEEVALVATAKPSQDSAGLVEGFTIEADGPHGRRLRREFDIHLFSDAASALAADVAAQGLRKAADSYLWHIAAAAPAEAEDAPPAFAMTATSAPLTYVIRPLAPLLRSASVVGTIDPRAMSVLYVRRAVERAGRLARRGAECVPAVETGAVLLGTLASCPESGEFYAVVTDALELADAEQKEFSLTYTGQTWARMRTILRARQAQRGGQTLRMLGQAHGHNFKPAGGAPPCEVCPTVKVCSRTSVFASLDDRAWTRAVLANYPWALCHIFGLNARGEGVAELYGLRDNRLQPRGYHVIEDFAVS